MKKLIFGITGTTGAGKSTISEEFRNLGVDVVDADALYHTLIKADMPCSDEIAAEFGTEVLKKNGDVDRKKLGAIVFGDEKKLNTLNKITHKYIKKAFVERTKKSAICAIDGAVIIGSDIESMCDFIVVVTAEEKERLKRIMSRDGISERMAKKRMLSQKDDDFYRERADFVIENNNIDEAKTKVEAILKKMIEKRSING